MIDINKDDLTKSLQFLRDLSVCNEEQRIIPTKQFHDLTLLSADIIAKVIASQKNFTENEKCLASYKQGYSHGMEDITGEVEMDILNRYLDTMYESLCTLRDNIVFCNVEPDIEDSISMHDLPSFMAGMSFCIDFIEEAQNKINEEVNKYESDNGKERE